MILTVRANSMTGIVDAPHDRGISLRHLADQEISGFYAMGGQRVENSVGVGWYRPIVESNHHLMIFQRQRLGVLHGADAAEIAEADFEHAGCAQGIRVAGTRLG